MMGHKEFFEGGVQTEEGTLSKGVAEKTHGLDLASSLWEE